MCRMYTRIFDMAVARARLDTTEIRPDRRVRALSKGMHVQLHLAIILAVNADLLVLDEPTLGLDVMHRQYFYDAVLNDFHTPARSVLVTTHEVREIEDVLTDVVFMHRGRSVLSLPKATIHSRYHKLTSPQPVQTPGHVLYSKRTPSGTEAIVTDVERAVLEGFGTVSTPNLAELFVAVVQDLEGQASV